MEHPLVRAMRRAAYFVAAVRRTECVNKWGDETESICDDRWAHLYHDVNLESHLELQALDTAWGK